MSAAKAASSKPTKEVGNAGPPKAGKTAKAEKAAAPVKADKVAAPAKAAKAAPPAKPVKEKAGAAVAKPAPVEKDAKPPKAVEAKDVKVPPKADEAAKKAVVEDAAAVARGKKMIHVRIDGKSKDLGLTDLSLTLRSADEDIVAVLAKHLRVDIERFALFRVERMKDGNIFLRPDAMFQDR